MNRDQLIRHLVNQKMAKSAREFCITLVVAPPDRKQPARVPKK